MPQESWSRIPCLLFTSWGDSMNWQEWSAVADDPSLWRNREEKGLLKAEYVADYVLRLWFEDEMDVSIYELDFRPLVVDDNPGACSRP